MQTICTLFSSVYINTLDAHSLMCTQFAEMLHTVTVAAAAMICNFT